VDGVKPGGSLLVGGGKRLVAAKPQLIALYIANLLLGWFATFGLSAQIGAVTGSSLYSEQLVRGFDLGVFLDLMNKPEITPYSQVPVAFALAGLFVLFQLFLTGGIITQFLSNTPRIGQSRFYAACGENFWRLVRVAIVSLIVAGLVGGILHAIRAGLDAATDNSAHYRAALALQFGMLMIEALALLWIRMWFDLSQTQLIATGARRIRASIGYGFKSARHAFGLYGNYVLLGIVTALVVAVAVFLWWTAAPSSPVIISFLILQSTLAFLLILRWWQRALAAAWYQQNIPLPVDIQSVSFEPLPPESAVPEVPLSQ
jgi:hypothetical protein